MPFAVVQRVQVEPSHFASPPFHGLDIVQRDPEVPEAVPCEVADHVRRPDRGIRGVPDGRHPCAVEHQKPDVARHPCIPLGVELDVSKVMAGAFRVDVRVVGELHAVELRKASLVPDRVVPRDPLVVLRVDRYRIDVVAGQTGVRVCVDFPSGGCSQESVARKETRRHDRRRLRKRT
jgi:hypothetical protein